MNTETFISQIVTSAITALYGEVNPAQVQIQKTRKEFEGDYTLVTFPLLKMSRKSPEATANEIVTVALRMHDSAIFITYSL